MRTGVPSRTAWGVALRRAAHQIFDRPLVFEDPIAVRLVGNDAITYIREQGRRPGRWRFRTLRAFLVARSRYAEDQLSGFVAQGGDQYVVLGAGLDTFAYRNPYASGLKVFEIDHPDTQAWKRECLNRAGIDSEKIEAEKSVTFIPVDFEKQSLDAALATAPGLQWNRSVFFSWLGVTPYLTRDAMLTTLRFIASASKGSGVVFDYAVDPSLLRWRDRIIMWFLKRRVARVGETFKLAFKPEELIQILRDAGFTRIEDLGAPEINALYFENREDRLRIRGKAGRIISCWV